MPDKDVSIRFLGESSGLVGAIEESISAMAAIQTQSKGFAVQMASIAINSVKPIAGALAGAFAAQQSLKAYAASDLPGAKAFVASMDATKKAIKGVAESVGEFLAPAAMWASKIIVQIATPLREAIRVFTAFRNSAVNFLKHLGLNFISAFAPIVPTATKAVNYIKSLFSGPGRNWAKDIENFRKEWNRVWGQILDYTAPIMVAVGGAIEASLKAIKNVAIGTFALLKGGFGELSNMLSTSIPAGASKSAMSIGDLTSAIQTGLITAIVGVEFAITNWQQSFEIAKSSLLLGVEVLRSSFVALGSDIWANMKVIGENMSAIFKVAAENIAVVFKAVWASIWEGAKNTLLKIAGVFANPIDTFKIISQGGLALDGFLKGLELQYPTFISPNLSGMKGMPGMSSLPGFTPRGISSDETMMRKELDALIDTFKSNFGPFLGGRMKEIEEAANAFKKTILGNLPGVSASVGAPVPGSIGDTKFAGAFQFGSREAYSAILKATGGDSKDLAEQKKQTRYLQNISDGIKKKPRPATI